MITAASEAVNSSDSGSQHRYWKKVATPQPFWPKGFLRIAALALVFITGLGATQPQLGQLARQQLGAWIGESKTVTASETLGNGTGVTRPVAQDALADDPDATAGTP